MAYVITDENNESGVTEREHFGVAVHADTETSYHEFQVGAWMDSASIAVCDEADDVRLCLTLSDNSRVMLAADLDDDGVVQIRLHVDGDIEVLPFDPQEG